MFCPFFPRPIALAACPTRPTVDAVNACPPGINAAAIDGSIAPAISVQ